MSLLSHMKKTSVPTPVMVRRFLSSPAPVHTKTLKLPYMSYSISGALVLSLAFFVSFAKQSLPGESLFTVKKAEEHVSNIIIGTYTPDPELQVALTLNRIEDAQAVLAKPDSPEQSRQAALKELTEQAERATSTLASNKISTESKQKIAQSLEQVKTKHDEIVSKALAVDSTKEAGQKTSDAFSKLSAAANALEETPRMTEQTVNKGKVSEITKTSIKLDQNVFVITPETKFIFGDKSLAFSDISVNMNVLVEYKNGVDRQTAVTIKLLDEPKLVQKPEVQPKPEAKPKPKPIEPEVNIDIQPNKAYGGFIPEDPTPECTLETPCE